MRKPGCSPLQSLPHHSLTESTKAERYGFLDKNVSAEERAGDSANKHFLGTHYVSRAVPGTDVYKTGNLLLFWSVQSTPLLQQDQLRPEK